MTTLEAPPSVLATRMDAVYGELRGQSDADCRNALMFLFGHFDRADLTTVDAAEVVRAFELAAEHVRMVRGLVLAVSA